MQRDNIAQRSQLSEQICLWALPYSVLLVPACLFYLVVSAKANGKPIFVSAVPQRSYTELKDRDDIPLLLEGKTHFFTGLDGIHLHMQLTYWPLVEVALLLIGLTHISFDKN